MIPTEVAAVMIVSIATNTMKVLGTDGRIHDHVVGKVSTSLVIMLTVAILLTKIIMIIGGCFSCTFAIEAIPFLGGKGSPGCAALVSASSACSKVDATCLSLLRL